MSRDPALLRWLAFSDAELDGLAEAIEAADLEGRCGPKALGLRPQITSELARRDTPLARRAARHAARPLVVGEHVVVTLTDPDARATFGHRLHGQVIEAEHDGLLLVRIDRNAILRVRRDEVRRRGPSARRVR